MTILLYLIPISLALGLAALLAFVWTVRNRQYEDLDGPAHRVLRDDPNPVVPEHARELRRLERGKTSLPN